MSLTIPYTFTGGPGNKIIAAQVNANFQAVASRFTEGVGGIADGDIATGAGIKGTKLTNIIGQRIPNDRFDDDTVDYRVLAGYADDASDSLRGVRTDNIQNLAVTAAKIANATILSGKLKTTVVSTQAFSQLVGAGGAIVGSRIAFSIAPSPALPLITNMLPVSIWITNAAGFPTVSGADYRPFAVWRADGSGNIVYELFCHAHTSGYTATGTFNFAYVAAS